MELNLVQFRCMVRLPSVAHKIVALQSLVGEQQSSFRANYRQFHNNKPVGSCELKLEHY
jgi:hypothetical protein